MCVCECSLKSSLCWHLRLSLGHLSAGNTGVHALWVELSRFVAILSHWRLYWSAEQWLPVHVSNTCFMMKDRHVCEAINIHVCVQNSVLLKYKFVFDKESTRNFEKVFHSGIYFPVITLFTKQRKVLGSQVLTEKENSRLQSPLRSSSLDGQGTENTSCEEVTITHQT